MSGRGARSHKGDSFIMGKRTRLFAVLGMIGCLGFIAGPALAANNGSKLKVRPVTFTGSTVDECGANPIPGDPSAVHAQWEAQQGLPDAGNSNHAFIMEKDEPTANCSAAGGIVDGVAGLPADTLGFDFRLDSACTGGAPRFNVEASDGFHFVGGCSNGTITPVGLDSQGRVWMRATFDLHNGAQSFPAVAPGATFVSVSLIQDEQGKAILDNINVDGTYIGKPGNA